MSFDPAVLEQALQILVLGWGGIFIVMIIIYILSMALMKIFPADKEK